MTIGKKVFRIALVLVLGIVVFYFLFYLLMLSSCYQMQRYTDANDFQAVIQEVHGADGHIPSTEELGNYMSVELCHKETTYILSKTNTLTLKATYTAAEFEKALDQMDAELSFVSQPKEGLSDYDAVINGYEIRIVSKPEGMGNGYFYDYPKCFIMIGVNKETCSLVYMYHYDSELDKIDDLDAFVKKHYTLP